MRSPHEIAKLQYWKDDAGTQRVTFASLHFIEARHWAVVKLYSLHLGRFTSWLAPELQEAEREGLFSWPYIKGPIMAPHKKGQSHYELGYIYTETTARGVPVYSGILRAAPVGKPTEKDGETYLACPIYLEDQL